MLPQLAIAALSLAASASASIWPAPQLLTQGESTVWLTQTLEITYNGHFVCWNCESSPNLLARTNTESWMRTQMPYTYGYTPKGPEFSSKEIVQGGVSRALGQIFADYFVPWKFHTRQELATFEPSVHDADKTWLKKLKITQTEKDTASTFKPLAGEVNESYNLTLSEDGIATIDAVSSTGVLHGLQTFTQLFYRHSGGPFWYTPIAPVDIVDYPKYPHRGLLMDVARNFFPVADIVRTIDALSWNKMNRLHIHATDSQSWPLDIVSMPEVAAKGAYHPSLVYTAEDIKNIQEHATRRGVEVIIEIDMPGHIGVLGESHPELVVAYGEEPYHWWCAEPPCGALRMNSTEVYDFLEDMFDDLLPRLLPYSAYFHTGGDELNKNDSMLDPGVGSNETSVLQPLLQKFIDITHKKVREMGLAPMVWEEIPTEWEIDIGEDVVVQSWLGGTAVEDLTAAGHKVIDSNYNFWYLDCGRGHWLNFDNGVAFDTFYPFNDWCSPAKGWRLIYSHDPAEGLPEEQAKLVLGGEVAAWAETIDPVNLDTILWPRTGALAEVLWSGRNDTETGEQRSQLDAAPRLAEMRERMVVRGVGSAPVQMIWCNQNDPVSCSYDMSV